MNRPDRYHLSIAVQVWQRVFTLAIYAVTGVSNNEEGWQKHRDTALEYLARARMMDMIALFCDGFHAGLEEAARKGLMLVRNDVTELSASLDEMRLAAEALLHERLAQLRESDDHDAVADELVRVPEVHIDHRRLLSPPGEEPERLCVPIDTGDVVRRLAELEQRFAALAARLKHVA